MLKYMGAIDELYKYLESGQCERDFKAAGEYERGMILESLERLMDLADLADETATKLIYRGLPFAEGGGKAH